MFFFLVGAAFTKTRRGSPEKSSSFPRSKASGYWDGGEEKSVGSTKQRFFRWSTMDVSEKMVGFTPTSSIFFGGVNSIINTIHFGVYTPIFGNIHMVEVFVPPEDNGWNIIPWRFCGRSFSFLNGWFVGEPCLSSRVYPGTGNFCPYPTERECRKIIHSKVPK